MKAFTENSADGYAVLLRAGEGEISENGSGAAQPRTKSKELAKMQGRKALDKGEIKRKFCT